LAREPLPFADVQQTGDGISIPDLKWRELVFVGALRCEGDVWERDPERPMPPFLEPDPFPPGRRFELLGRRDGRVLLRRLPASGAR